MKTIASEYKKRRKANTVAEEYRARQGGKRVVPSPSAPPAEAQPPDLSKLEAPLVQVLEAQSRLLEAINALRDTLPAKPRTPPASYDIRINTRDGNHNIKSLTVTPNAPVLH